MNDKSLALALGKVIIAAAWADGQVHEDEMECIKDLIYHLPDLDPKDLHLLNKLTQTPIGNTERSVLIDNLLSKLRTQEDKDFALYALDRVIKADGRVTEQEQAFVKAIEEQLKQDPTPGLFTQIKNFLKNPLRYRAKNVKATSTQESVSELVKKIIQEMRKQKAASNLIQKSDIQKLCLAGILLSKIVWSDGRIHESEVKTLVHFLQNKWKLNERDAYIVARISLDPNIQNLDTIRTCRAFHEITSLDERVQFLDVLFAIAYADGVLSNKEVDDIVNITANLKLEQDHFHNALMRYSREETNIA